jgi:hypothetical protein
MAAGFFLSRIPDQFLCSSPSFKQPTQAYTVSALPLFSKMFTGTHRAGRGWYAPGHKDKRLVTCYSYKP